MSKNNDGFQKKLLTAAILAPIAVSVIADVFSGEDGGLMFLGLTVFTIITMIIVILASASYDVASKVAGNKKGIAAGSNSSLLKSQSVQAALVLFAGYIIFKVLVALYA